MRNGDVMQLFDAVEEGAIVEISGRNPNLKALGQPRTWNQRYSNPA